MLRHCALPTLLVLFLSATQGSSASFQTSCENFASKVKIPNVHVNFVEYIASGTNLSLPDNPPSCLQSSQLVYAEAVCRVAMRVNTSQVSEITLEAWLPANWTGRFLSTGNGGVDGCIQYADVAYGSSFGFATVGANNGHNGTSGKAFFNAPEVVKDFAWRSIHTGVVVGKEITKLFYGKDFTKSYYLGCSTGGRQGMKSAEMFPNDFNGIVAGAPATDFNDLTSWSGLLGVRTGFDNTSADFVGLEQWAIIHDEILRQCDMLDGAADGIIEDPDLCQPNLNTLICAAGTTDKSTCLNGAQAARASSIFTPFYGINGTLIFPRLQPGGELDAYFIDLDGLVFPYTHDWFAYAVFNNPNFDATKLTLEDCAYAAAKNPGNISSFDANLTPFKNSGGKILTYQGMQDQVITSDQSARWYQRIAQTMSLPPSDLDDFYRYFRVSGMGHCAGGPGAWNIGQVQSGDPNTYTAQDNALIAIVQWVEKGVAPEFMRGTKFVNDTAALGVQFTRKHCKYPARNMYVGEGQNYGNESNWKCVTDLPTLLTQS